MKPTSLSRVLVLLALASTARAQTTWYVDVHGIPPGGGTQASPYTSLQDAISRPTTLPGDTILVAPGDYDETIDFHDKNIIVRSTAGAAATRLLRYAYVQEGYPTVMVLEGFTIFGGANVFGGTLSRCVVIGVGAPAEHLQGIVSADSARIQHCVVSGFGVAIKDYPLSTGEVLVENSVLWNCDSGVSSYNGGTMRFCAGVISAFNFTVSDCLPGDPLLWNLESGDVRLRPGSPCIDTGNPATANDPDGSRADIGVFPYDPTYAPGPTAYCTGKLNSQGCVPAIGFSGSASASSASPFFITASLVVPHRRGLFFYGYAPDSVPFQGATHCVLQPTRRAAGQDSLGGPAPCTGSFSFDFNARIQLGIDPMLVPGALVYGQYWFRDPADPTGFQSGLTNAIAFGIAP